MVSSESADQDWKGLYSVGGIMGALTGVGGLAASRMGYLLYSAGYPSNTEAYLQLVSQQQLRANSLWSLWVFGDLLGFVPSVAEAYPVDSGSSICCGRRARGRATSFRGLSRLTISQ